MVEQIYVLEGKHGNIIGKTALGILKCQLAEWYPYEDDENLVTRAQRVVDNRDEVAAYLMLSERSDWEYERFYRDELMD